MQEKACNEALVQRSGDNIGDYPMSENKTHKKTAIALQGGGALGAYSFGALKYIYESEPDIDVCCVSGVSIGAFTAAIVASHPKDPIPNLAKLWQQLTVFHSSFVPPQAEKFLAFFGNSAFYQPRLDFYDFPLWTSLYNLSPIATTLKEHVDLAFIARGKVGLVVTATDVESGTIEAFDNRRPERPLTIDHLIASGSIPPNFPARMVDGRSYWDGGLFDNTPLSALLNRISPDEAETTRVIVINLFPTAGVIPKTMFEVWDRMTEIQFSNKTAKDVALARKINQLVAAIERLQGLPSDHKDSVTQLPEFADLAKYKLFDSIIAITNKEHEAASSATDFSKASIDRRMAAGYRDAEAALRHPPKRAADLARAIVKPN
jgi:NTE family protein